MGTENLRYIGIQDYLYERIVLDFTQQPLFDFLYLTGTRNSESLSVKRTDFDWDKETVFIHTLKSRKDKMRDVMLLPKNRVLIDSVKTYALAKKEDLLWNFFHRKKPRTYVWELAKKAFLTYPHSFRHTHATILARDFRLNSHELMEQMGWGDIRLAQIYVKYDTIHSITQKVQEYYEKKGLIQ